jgi:hypothetical protein
MSFEAASIPHHGRFDIVTVSPYHWPRHIENAFTPAD